jgi:hypothetical protein
MKHGPPLLSRHIHASTLVCSQHLCASKCSSRARDVLIAASSWLVVATVRCQIHFFFSKRVKLLTISDLYQTFHDKGLGDCWFATVPATRSVVIFGAAAH